MDKCPTGVIIFRVSYCNYSKAPGVDYYLSVGFNNIGWSISGKVTSVGYVYRSVKLGLYTTLFDNPI